MFTDKCQSTDWPCRCQYNGILLVIAVQLLKGQN